MVAPHCSADALTDFFGWFLQGLLAGLAFSCLIAKRFFEPKSMRRSWLIWFYDTSKQGMGAMTIHMANIWLASQYTGDPCTWYLIHFLLDSSVGLLILFVGIRICQKLSKRKGWENINFGEYGKPPSSNAWLTQCALYVLLMIVVKICITAIMHADFWDSVKEFILSPIDNAKLEQALVMLIIPFFVNMLMFWVTDNFLMHKSNMKGIHSHPSLLHRARIKYKSLRMKKPAPVLAVNRQDSDIDISLSGDDELIDVDVFPISINTTRRQQM